MSLKTEVPIDFAKLQALAREMDALILEGCWNEEAYRRLLEAAAEASGGQGDLASFLRLKAEPEWLDWGLD